MQIVRTIVWVLILVALLAFSFLNWNPVEVQIWNNLVLETKVPALVIISFLLGLVPMWLIHRGTKWHLHRRIATLENAARANAVSLDHREAEAAEAAAAAPTSPPVAEPVAEPTPIRTTATPDRPDPLAPTRPDA